MAVRGSKEALIEKPYIAPIISGLLLKWPTFTLEQVELCLEYGVPIFSTTMPVGGVSGPITIPGNILLGVVTTLFGIIFSQLAKPGHPVVEMYHPTFMEITNGKVGGMPENYMGEEIRTQMLNDILGIPTCDGTTPNAASAKFNQDAIFEITYNFRDSYNNNMNGYWGTGAIDTGIVYSPHATIFINELVDMAKREQEPLEIDSNTLPVDLVKRVKGGVYLSEEHTIKNMHKCLWRGQFFHRKKEDTTLDLFDRLDLAYIDILEKSKLACIDEVTREKIMNIVNSNQD